MDSFKNMFDSFREFIWDILGYFIPGAFLMTMLSFFLTDNHHLDSSILLISSDNAPYFFVLISYVLGYVIYGVGEFLKDFHKGKSFQRKIERELLKSKEVLMSIKKLKTIFNSEGYEEKFDEYSFRNLRNLVMSYIPDSDQKIYTFTFRSDLANHIGNICLALGAIGIISLLISFFSNCNIFKTSPDYIAIYFLLFLCYFFLQKTRDRFYKISMSIPFSIFNSRKL